MSQEKLRLEKLRDYKILDTPPSENFDSITAFTSKLFDVPICLISLVDESRQWFKSRIGVGITETTRCSSFCSVAIENPSKIMIVNDATSDLRFNKNPLVINDPFVKFYAGAPLVTNDGLALGTLCIIDRVARKITKKDEELLRMLSAMVVRLIAEHLNGIETKIQEKEKDFILNNIPSQLFFKDDKNNILFANNAVAKKLEIETKELVDQPTAKFFPNLAEKLYRDDIEVLNSSQGKFGIIERYRNKLGKDVWYKTDKIPLGSDATKNNRILVIATDITHEIKLEKKLAEQTSLNSAILNCANFAILSTDLNGVIKTFNHGAEKLLGYEAFEIVEKHTPEIFQDLTEFKNILTSQTDLPFSLESTFNIIQQKSDLGLAHEYESIYTTKTGEKIPVQISLTTLVNSQKEKTGYLSIAKDISTNRKIEESDKTLIDLVTKIEQLELVIQRKSNFFSTMSHEIRTPLTSVISLASLLLDSLKNSEHEEDLIGIVDSANQLKHLIDAILDFAKIETGNLGMRPAHVNTRIFLDDLNRLFLLACSKKSHTPKFLIDDNFPLTIYIDQSRTKQIFGNIISNATKFSEENTQITLEAKFCSKFLTIIVQDQGSGIPDSDLNSVFEPYTQIDGSYSRNYTGLGLGLPLSKSLLEIMQGNITIAPAHPQGTRVEITIPLDDSQVEHSCEDVEKFKLNNKTVLLAEDNLLNRLTISKLLKSFGLNVTEAKDGFEVLEKLKKEDFDLILLDIHMPNLNGIEVLEKLNNSGVTSSIPIAMLSACALETEINYTRKIGAKAFISKPIDHQEFKGQLKSLLQG